MDVMLPHVSLDLQGDLGIYLLVAEFLEALLFLLLLEVLLVGHFVQLHQIRLTNFSMRS